MTQRKPATPPPHPPTRGGAGQGELWTFFSSAVFIAVNYLSQVIFVSLLFLGLVMYANEVETKGN